MPKKALLLLVIASIAPLYQNNINYYLMHMDYIANLIITVMSYRFLTCANAEYELWCPSRLEVELFDTHLCF
jgi:hypothetical protein